MAEVASAFVTLVPDGRGFGRGISGQIGGDLDRAGKTGGKRLGGGLSSTFLPATKALAGAAAGIFAAAKIGGFLKDSIAEARESQKVGAITANVIKTTGSAAKVTAGQVGDLATAISNKTGIDDEAVQSASNLLLTFTNVRNEVGKGNDIFNQATQASTDMATAMGKAPKDAAIQLGKALNDPVKGITALSKVGVSFTAQQKKQIKTLVESGDTLGAQKIILGELNKEFGGTAAAASTGGEKLATAFGNFKEQIGTALLPVIDKVAGFLTTKIIPAMSGFISGMQDGSGAGGAFVKLFKSIWEVAKPIGEALLNVVVPAVKGMFAAFQSNGGPGKIMALFVGIKSAIATAIPVVVQFVTGTLVPLFQQAVSFITTKVVPGVLGIIGAFRGYLTVVIPIVQQFVAGMMARIGPLMPQIKAIFSTIGQIIVQVMSLVQAVITRVTAIIGGIWSRWGTQIMDVVGFVFKTIVAVIGAALKVVSAVIKTVTALIKGDWSGAWAGMKQIVSAAWGLIKTIISAALTVVKSVLSAGLNALKGIASRAWDGVKSAISAGVSGAVELVKSLPGKIVSALGNLGRLLYDAGAKLIQGLADGIMSRIHAVTDAVGNVASKIKGFFPGSPVKEGPLTSWNNGGAGKRLGGMLAEGLAASRSQVAAASRGLAGGVIVGGSAGGLGAAGAGGRSITIQGNVGWSPSDLAGAIDERERRQAALHPVFGG